MKKKKNREYNSRIMNIEQGTFTPLVFTVSGVLGKECCMFLKQMAKKIANKFSESYKESYVSA